MKIIHTGTLLSLLLLLGLFGFAERVDADELYTELWGTVQSAPAAADGHGTWTVLSDDEVAHTVTADAATRFLPDVPSVGQEILLSGLVGSDGVIRAHHMVYWTRPVVEQTLLDAVWSTVLGQVTSVPGSDDGTGMWEIMDDTATSYRISVFDPAVFADPVPGAGQHVLVEGFQLPNGDISAATFSLASAAPDPTPAAPDLLEFSGRIAVAPTPVGSATWIIETGADEEEMLYPVIVNAQTVFYPEIATVGDWVHVTAVETIVNEASQYEAVEIALDTFAAGEIVARLATDVLSSTVAARYNLIPQETLLASGEIHRFLSTNPTGRYLASVIERMALDPDVVWVEFNQIGAVPLEGDPHSTWGWGGTEPSTYVNSQVLRQINLVHAHEQVRGADVVIAILDTGVDVAHPALQGHLLPGWDMVDDDDAPLDAGSGMARGHGTHVTGIAARIAPESHILPVRVLDANGRGDMFVLAYAIEWAVQNGADVINLSLGSAENSRVLSEAIIEAMAQDVVVVAAAGNDNSNVPRYPAAQPGVLAVTAVDGDGQKADFANYGAWVSIAAPGVGITSTIVGPEGSGYATWSGTSMATPFVSGAAALLRQHNPDFSAVQTGAWLIHNSSALTPIEPVYADQLGGLLDVDAALTLETLRRLLYMPVVLRE